jgi:hypothetical protein
LIRTAKGACPVDVSGWVPPLVDLVLYVGTRSYWHRELPVSPAIKVMGQGLPVVSAVT